MEVLMGFRRYRDIDLGEESKRLSVVTDITTFRKTTSLVS